MAAEVVINVTENSEDAKRGLADFGSIMSGLKDTVDLVSGAFNAAVGFVTPFITSAIEGQNSVADLEATLRSTGNAVGMTSQELQDLATNYQNTTKFSDDMVLSAESMLLTFTNIGKDVFPMATEAVLNIAEKMGTDAPAAAIQLGKALNDPIAGITALTRVGVTFTDEQKEQIKTMMEAGDTAGAQKVILAELEKEFGGLAESMGDTFQGKWTIFLNNLDNIREAIGTAILPLLTSLLDKIMETGGVFDQFSTIVNNALSVLDTEGIFGAIDVFFGSLFERMYAAVAEWVLSGGPEELSNNLISWLDDLATGPATESKALEFASKLLSAITYALSRVDWGGIASALDDALTRAIQDHDWTSSGDSFGNVIAGALSGGLSTSMGSGQSNAVTAIVNGISDWFLAAAGVENWQAFGQFWIDLVNYIELAGTNAIRNLLDSDLGSILGTTLLTLLFPPSLFETVGGQMREIAGEIINGLWNGLQDGLNALGLGDLSQWWYDHIVKPVKQILGIASPSTVFMDIGKNIIEGLVNGMLSLIDWAENQIKSLISTMLAPFQPLLDFLGIDTSWLNTTSTSGGTNPSTGSTGTSYGGYGGPVLTSGTGTTSGGVLTSGTGGVINNFYGTVNFGDMSQIGYDCPSPHPLMTASSQSMLTAPTIG